MTPSRARGRGSLSSRALDPRSLIGCIARHRSAKLAAALSSEPRMTSIDHNTNKRYTRWSHLSSTFLARRRESSTLALKGILQAFQKAPRNVLGIHHERKTCHSRCRRPCGSPPRLAGPTAGETDGHRDGRSLGQPHHRSFGARGEGMLSHASANRVRM